MNKALSISALALALSLPLGAHAFGPGASSMGGATAPAGVPLAGKVAETMASGGYTYLLLERDGKKTWAAIPETPVEVGREITLKPGMEMKNFASKALKRTFESIYFSEGLASAVESTAGKSSPGSKGVVVAPAEQVKVEKAASPNAHTIAETYEQRGSLDGKPVAVRGKVMRVSAGIMGKNWVHLQDGSGDAKKGTNDLTVTTQDLPAVGDVVTATGTLRKDKDFGGGYRYQVIIEEGTVKR
ncbi:hypothetical protein GeomeDRAFT_2735 [Geobacter metallireducens RCH3]|uniref:DNA-binding protein n=1 Tax=Geobacter metallireducens (strain ATCC 53774 / DSM 7210 / GS-15) TaxID=269799 RepID=Q39ZG5_GEOMG|nr:OB-fold nucleic acid binding domain-containing protein [Geobacter metallireducens]ABB30359.1 hypothetical protein Gmet_0110 [Geobacter metallireducens GS-15]EHP85024.1 hypothetical protein GeomeDRAFT_2735 [Geobacter metallireducens RCH3]